MIHSFPPRLRADFCPFSSRNFASVGAVWTSLAFAPGPCRLTLTRIWRQRNYSCPWLGSLSIGEVRPISLRRTCPRALIGWSLFTSRVAFTGGTRQTPLSHNTREARQYVCIKKELVSFRSLIQQIGRDRRSPKPNRSAYLEGSRGGLTATISIFSCSE